MGPLMQTSNPGLSLWDSVANWWQNWNADIKGGEFVTSPNITQLPVAPQTRGAMTVPGVWTPDYAMQRYYDEINTSLDMQRAAGEVYRGNTTYEDTFPSPDTLAWWKVAIFVGLGIWAISAIPGSGRR